MISGFSDDMRQAVVVMKNEIHKFFSGRKMVIYTALMVMILVLLTSVLFYFKPDFQGAIRSSELYVALMSLFLLLGATLFSSSSLVSEFEERTALILFTRPVRKYSIFIGKLMASLIVISAFTVVYYMVTYVVDGIYLGEFDNTIFKSLGLALCYMVSSTGVAFLVSAMFKKASTAAMMTFFALLLFFSLAGSVLMIAGVDDTWFMLNNASSDIMSVLSISAPAENPIRSALVMLAWGIVPLIVGFLIFRKRDF